MMSHFSKFIKSISLASLLSITAIPSYAVVQAMYTAASGADAMSTSVNTNADNIANVNTVGYKSHKANLASNFYYDLIRAGSILTEEGGSVPAGISIGTGSHVQSVYRVNQQGSFDHTENTYDMAIRGKGYFIVQGGGENGEDAYTRDGSFSLNQDGDLVTSHGYIVSPGINIPLEAVSVTTSKEGIVRYKLTGQEQFIDAGQIQLSNFMNENGLHEIGDNLMIVTQASGPANAGNPKDVGYGMIFQGFLENSNVSLVTEMTSLIKNQRAFQANMRVLSIADNMLESVIR